MTVTSVPTPDDQPTDAAAGADGGAVAPAPDAHGPDGPTPRRRRWWLWGIVVAVVLAGVAGILFIPTPYYLLEPGSVRPAETRVDVKGARSYDSKGDVLFTTVYIDQATLATLLRGAIDDAIEVKSEDEVYGKQGRDASQQENQQRMDLSKLIATKVALNYLGFPAEFAGKGARVLGLSKDSPATGKLRPGDVIVSVDGSPVQLPKDIGAALADRKPGDVVAVSARRGGGAEARTVEEQITLGAAPDSATRPILGVSVDPDQPTVDSPVSVGIDSGTVTGPSAGLAWSLAVVDRLTPGSLTKGRNVAVTGEILPDGTVGPIGGIAQKVAAVKRAGVKMFLYPASTPEAEQKEMRRISDGAVELRPVKTLQEAVEVLAPGGVTAPDRPAA
jgi:PDZ domain-containing protein